MGGSRIRHLIACDERFGRGVNGYVVDYSLQGYRSISELVSASTKGMALQILPTLDEHSYSLQMSAVINTFGLHLDRLSG